VGGNGEIETNKIDDKDNNRKITTIPPLPPPYEHLETLYYLHL
jgi:hypothetical protein